MQAIETLLLASLVTLMALSPSPSMLTQCLSLVAVAQLGTIVLLKSTAALSHVASEEAQTLLAAAAEPAPLLALPAAEPCRQTVAAKRAAMVACRPCISPQALATTYFRSWSRNLLVISLLPDHVPKQ